MILITNQAAQAVDALGSREIEYSIVPLAKEGCSNRCSEKDVKWRKKTVLDLYNKFVWMRCDPYEEYEISVSDKEIIVERENKCNNWVIPVRGVLKDFSVQQIWYLLGECAVIKSLNETTELMHQTNAEYYTNYTCPIHFARKNGYIIQL